MDLALESVLPGLGCNPRRTMHTPHGDVTGYVRRFMRHLEPYLAHCKYSNLATGMILAYRAKGNKRN